MGHNDLRTHCILLLIERDAGAASRLVVEVENAGADVVVAAHATEALQHVDTFTFTAAAIDYWQGANRDRVASRLRALDVPFVVLSAHAPPAEWRAPAIARPGEVVGALARLLDA
jgi:DNA-binding response OmpR family regulator